MTNKNDEERQQIAFERYFELGETRSLERLGKHHRYTIDTLKNWSRKYNWQGKLIARLRESDRLAQEEAIRNIGEQRGQYIVGMHNALVQFFQKVTTGEIPAKDFNDMDKILRNLRLEMGQPTDYTRADQNIQAEFQINHTSEDGLFERAKRINPELEKRLGNAFDSLLEIEREIIEAEAGSGG